VIPDGRDTSNSPSYATFAAAALQAVDEKYDTLEVRWTSLDIATVSFASRII
jgi:hypothetical protein